MAWVVRLPIHFIRPTKDLDAIPCNSAITSAVYSEVSLWLNWKFTLISASEDRFSEAIQPLLLQVTDTCAVEVISQEAGLGVMRF